MSDDQSVYAIAQLSIQDWDAFLTDYAGPIQSIHAKHGVEVLAASGEAHVVEGDYASNFTVILRFPSADAQAKWYADTEYQPLIARRREITDTMESRLLVLPAFRGDAP